MEITIHEKKISHFTFHGKKGPITSHENTLYHPHTTYNWFQLRTCWNKLNKLLPVCQIARDPIKRILSNTVVIELIGQNMMINSVKSFRKVLENSSSRLSVIHCRNNIINQLNQCHIRRMISTNSKLIVLKKIMIC